MKIAGCLAKLMGAPISLITAVNENDIVARTFANGDFSTKDHVVASLSSAMDIQVLYKFNYNLLKLHKTIMNLDYETVLFRKN